MSFEQRNATVAFLYLCRKIHRNGLNDIVANVHVLRKKMCDNLNVAAQGLLTFKSYVEFVFILLHFACILTLQPNTPLVRIRKKHLKESKLHVPQLN